MRMVLWGAAALLSLLPVAAGWKSASSNLGGRALAVMPSDEIYAKKKPQTTKRRIQEPAKSHAPATLPATPQNVPAVHDGSEEAVSPVSTIPFKIDIPMAWEMTRARLMGSGASTLTESFRETWTLELRPTGGSFLTSPRARVRVYASGVKYSAADTHSASSVTSASEPAIPIAVEAVGVPERDFARLIGLPGSNDPENEVEANEELDASKLVTLNLLQRASTDVTLSLSDDEHFAVHIELANTSAVF